jgi:hypothetical protein
VPALQVESSKFNLQAHSPPQKKKNKTKFKKINKNRFLTSYVPTMCNYGSDDCVFISWYASLFLSRIIHALSGNKK